MTSDLWARPRKLRPKICPRITGGLHKSFRFGFIAPFGVQKIVRIVAPDLRMAIVFKSFGWRLRILFVMLIVETPLPADFAFIAGTGFGGLMSRSENRAGQGVMIRRISNLHVVTRLRSLGALRAVGTIEYSDEVNESKLPPRPDGPDPFSISRAEINGLKEKIKRLVEGSLKTGENQIFKQIS